MAAGQHWCKLARKIIGGQNDKKTPTKYTRYIIYKKTNMIDICMHLDVTRTAGDKEIGKCIARKNVCVKN